MQRFYDKLTFASPPAHPPSMPVNRMSDASQPTSISLRVAVAADETVLFDVYASARCEEVQAWGWTPEQQRIFLRMQFDARRRSYRAEWPEAVESIVLEDDTPVGGMMVARSSAELRLLDIAVLSQHRNRGLGSRLILDLIHAAAEAKLPLRLSVAKWNTVQAHDRHLAHLYDSEQQPHADVNWC